MKHPKSENILKVINNFKKVIKKFPDGELDMYKAAVNQYNDECGTVHCHAGWYAVVACDLSKCLWYSDGANKMAQDIGLKWSHLLVEWAGQSTEIWGNDYGFDMFCCRGAFVHPEKRPDGADNLQHIVDHWTEVYERVRNLEEAK